MNTNKSLIVFMRFIEIVSGLKTGTWIPIGSKSSLPHKSSIKILNQDLVIWKNNINQEWSLIADVCPHRLAPLSQGLLDEKTGCLECPYHGWQFDEKGKCTKIPQSKGNRNEKKNEKKQNVKSFPVMETGDILWGNFNLYNSSDSFTKKPNEIFPELDDVETVFSRDLPYSFDFLVENFMDPAHIPFAHHGLQGLRTDGINIPMKVITDMNDDSKLEIQFRDRIRGKMRDGVVSFTNPCYYHFRIKDNKTKKKDYKIELMVLITPVSPGNSRVHLAFMNSNIPNKVPKWISHSFSNQFLETDIWLHNCELEASKSNREAIDAYYMPTSSDIGPRSWRKWWERHMTHIPAFSSNLDMKLPKKTPQEQKERFESHIDNCKHCQKALKRVKFLKKFSIFSLLFINKKPLLSIVLFCILKSVASKMEKMIIGDF